MTAHRLDPLLKPVSMAIIGASNRPGSLGLLTAQQAKISGFSGPSWAVNPNYQNVAGIPCFQSIEALPGVPEHVVLAVPNAQVENEMRKAIALGVRSATIFASCYLPEDTDQDPLIERLRKLATDSGLLVCGGNCLGFMNLVERSRATWCMHPDLPAGSVGLIAHSGSVFITMPGVDRRLHFNYVVSAGQEISVTAADYLDFMLDQPSTRVIGLFLETVRDPKGFVDALAKANEREIPIVALKVGRTARSADLARSHSGALAGDDAAYEAVFRKYGVTRVSTLDEFSATLQMMSHPKRLVTGRGIAAVHDSGGARGMAIDLADDIGIPYATISAETRQILSDTLEHGLAPENPLDVWGTGKDFDNVFDTCFHALLDEPDTALGILFSDIGNGTTLDQPWVDAAMRVARSSRKPVFIAQNLSRTNRPDWLADMAAQGLPVLDGTENALKAARHWLKYRDFLSLPRDEIRKWALDGAVVEKWRDRLRGGAVLGEDESLRLFADFGLRTPKSFVARDRDELRNGIKHMDIPVALKTAEPGILHKSDVGGVVLDISSAEALEEAYVAMSERLGPNVLVAEMAPSGVELALGMVSDQQFGPLAMVAAGGIFIELFNDRHVVVPPISVDDASRLLAEMRVRPLLDKQRGRAGANMPALAETISRFTQMVACIGDLVDEIDANPVIAGPNGTVCVDGIVFPKKP